MDAATDASRSATVHIENGVLVQDLSRPHPLRAQVVRPHVQLVRVPSVQLPDSGRRGHVPLAVRAPFLRVMLVLGFLCTKCLSLFSLVQLTLYL